MKVLITGGAGHIGKPTAERLVQRGWDVRMIGLETEVDIPGVEFTTCDIMNYDELRKQMHGCDAVIHLAALRGPNLAPGPKIFEINVSGTFNVFEAAAAEGIGRVVQASSINALGAVWGNTDMRIDYFPVDEAHWSFTTDPYSFSKEMIESIGQYYWRRDGISSVALRFPSVYASDFVKSASYRASREKTHMMLDALAASPETERRARLAEARERALEFRKRRSLEYKDGITKWSQRNESDDPLQYTYTIDRFNLWALVDVRDAAQSLERGVTANYDGAHALFINDHHNSIGYDSQTLIRFFFPEVSTSKSKLSGSESLVSIEKARALIGFEPEYSVADWDTLNMEDRHDENR